VRYVLDTNILLRIAQRNHPMHRDALKEATRIAQNQRLAPEAARIPRLNASRLRCVRRYGLRKGVN
jgi:hypothetical protein